jgi:membrane protein DedA with SNARE-associated domain
VLDFITQWVSGSPATYPLITALAIADIIGIFPAETVIIAATLLALHGPLLVMGIAAAAIVGALIGDNILFLIGRHGGGWLCRRLVRGQKSQERLQWAQRAMRRHRDMIIIGGRFLPGGRTVVMLAAGLLEVPWGRFAPADLVAVLLWAGYYVGVTVALGNVFSQMQWLTLVIALAIGLLIGGVAEATRRISLRRQSQQPARTREHSSEVT